MTVLPMFVLNHLHKLYKKSEQRDQQLLYLFLEITRKCNLACRHCGSDCISQGHTRELTTASWLKIIEDMANQFFPPPTLVLTGGEPILHPDFRRIIEKIHSIGMRWGLVTNGYNINARKIELLEKNGIQSITISLDGSRQSHNWLRGKSDSFRKTIKAMEHISSSNIPLKDAVTCVNPKNLTELDAIAQLLIDHGIPSWRLFRIFPAGRARGKKELLLSTNKTREMIDWISSRKTELLIKGLDVNLSCEGWLPYEMDQKVRNQPFFCRSGVNIASILCDGTITGCSNNDERFFEGNVLQDNFAYIWKNRFKEFRDRSWVHETACGGCDHLKECEGSSLHLWRGNPDKPEFCYMDCYDLQHS